MLDSLAPYGVRPIAPRSVGGDRPFWSVMVTTHNRPTYLETTLRSVLAQDPGSRAMQIEVVDDGSQTQAARAIVQRLGRDRVTYTYLPRNLGQPRIYDECIRRARGQVIHLLHDDDVVLPGFYAHLQAAFTAHPEIGAAFCRHYVIDPQGKPMALSRLERPDAGILAAWPFLLSLYNFHQFVAIAVRRSTYERLGGFCPAARTVADWEMWKRIAWHYPGWYEPQTLACYRWHDTATSRQSVRNGRRVIDCRTCIAIARHYLPADRVEALSERAALQLACQAIALAGDCWNAGDMEGASIDLREGIRTSDAPVVRAFLVDWLRRLPGDLQPSKPSGQASPSIISRA